MTIPKNSFIVWSHAALKRKCLTTFFINSLWSRGAYLFQYQGGRSSTSDSMGGCDGRARAGYENKVANSTSAPGIQS